MRELSLFTGAGGGVLGSKLLGHQIVGYVEYEKYCQEIIKQRIADGILDAAPIFGDIRRFISEGYAEAYKDVVDVVTGGFPCQPFSVAGKQKGSTDERDMWPATFSCIQIIRPKYVFIENVPGLLNARSSTCLCGWPGRRGRVHSDSVIRQGELLLRRSIGWDVSKGGAVIDGDDGEIPGDDSERSEGDRESGRIVEMAYRWGRSVWFSENDTSVSAFEKRTGDAGIGFGGDLQGEKSKRFAEMDRQRKEDWLGEQGEDALIEQKRPDCPCCGRRLVYSFSRLIQYLGKIFGQLSESGYDCRWDVIGADDVGANHRRKRLWILAYTNSDKKGISRQVQNKSSSETLEQRRERQAWGRSISNDMLEYFESGQIERRPDSNIESPIRRTSDGMANTNDRLKAIGNGQVPLCMAYAFSKLSEGIIK